MKTKQRVYVKATSKRKSHYRMQEVGREEIESVENLWEISRDQLKRLCTGNKMLLKEQYMRDYKYTEQKEHPKLKYLHSLMSDSMKISSGSALSYFVDRKQTPHERAIEMALVSNDYVPLYVLKDYPELAKQYGFDTSESMIEDEARQMKPDTTIYRLYEMSKTEYDAIIESVKMDYDVNPKHINDKMLKSAYPQELDDIKRAAKLRKKIFDNIPPVMKHGQSPDTMNSLLHREMLQFAMKNNFEIPEHVKAGYPTIFTDMPFNYEPTGDSERDAAINKILTNIRDGIGDEPNTIKMQNIIDKQIGSDGRTPDHYTVELSPDGEESVEFTMDDVGHAIGSDLMDRIKKDGYPVLVYADTMRPFNRNDEIHLSPQYIDHSDIIAHEYGHAIEQMFPDINELSQTFLKRRTEGDPLIPLSDIVPFGGYEGEYTRPDDFMDPYIGKSYISGDTEVLSVGMGYLQSDRNMEKLYYCDPEYLGFIISVVSGKGGSESIGKDESVENLRETPQIEINLAKLS